MVPSFIISIWISGLLSIALFAGGAYLGYYWYQTSWAFDVDLNRYVFNSDLGWNYRSGVLAASCLLLIWTFAGALVLRLFAKFSRRTNSADGESPVHTRTGTFHSLARADGTLIHVETYGPDSGQPIILTHGWGGDSTEWYYLKRQLTDRYRVIVWDLQGLGMSEGPTNNDYSLSKMASDLNAVIQFAGDKPPILLGHSIGVMIQLVYCQNFRTALKSQIAGIVLVHGTYKNPLRTTKRAKLHTALERPLIIPLLYLTIWLSPLVWIMNWVTYLSGLGHWSMKSGGFAGTETWAQVDFMTQFQPYVSPRVFARGCLGMLNFDATATLPSINVPTLVVAADHDETCIPQASEYLHKSIHASQIEILSPAKHMGLIEQNQRMGEIVGVFAAHCFRVFPQQ